MLSFNRPEKTRSVLQRIREAAPPRIYAHCDGPRAQVPADAEKVLAVQQVIQEESAGIELHTFFRTENAGLRTGISGAVSWFFEQEPYGIILEDDCLPDPTMFPFCSELLLKYQDDPEVMHIGCSNLAEAYTLEQESSYVFSHLSFIWGWASWRRAWEKMQFNFEGLEEFKETVAWKQFLKNPLARLYLLDKFRAVQQGRINTWDYALFYSILKDNGLCIVPKINLVQNVGVGEEDATNTTGDNREARRRAGAMQFPLNHPPHKSVQPSLEALFFYTTQKRRLRLWLWSILHWTGLR